MTFRGAIRERQRADERAHDGLVRDARQAKCSVSFDEPVRIGFESHRQCSYRGRLAVLV